MHFHAPYAILSFAAKARKNQGRTGLTRRSPPINVPSVRDLANLLGGAIPVDIIFGSIATLIGAFFTYKLRNTGKWTAPIPPIVSNIVIVPLVLRYGYGINLPIPFMMLTVGAGEFISAGVIGMILLGALSKYKNVLFHKKAAV